jgi:hypothetical protein
MLAFNYDETKSCLPAQFLERIRKNKFRLLEFFRFRTAVSVYTAADYVDIMQK